MRRIWPGWVLCALTAILFAYMAGFEAPAISEKLNGMKLPDVVVLGYDLDGAKALYAAFVADLADAEEKGRQSASAAYVSLHAGSDLLFPPLLTASLVFLAFAGLNTPRNRSGAPRLARVGLGLVLALAFAYLGCDYVENAVADAMFGPPSLQLPLNEGLVPVLRGLTIAKYLTLLLAFGLILALWTSRWFGAKIATDEDRPHEDKPDEDRPDKAG